MAAIDDGAAYQYGPMQGYWAPDGEVFSLRTFSCCNTGSFGDKNIEAGEENGVRWSQTLGQMQLLFLLDVGVGQDDVLVEMSKILLKVTVAGVQVKELSQKFYSEVWRKDSWWAVQDTERGPCLVINLFKRVASVWKGPWFSAGQFNRNSFHWTRAGKEMADLKFMEGNGGLLRYPADVPAEAELDVLDPGLPKPEEDMPAPGGGYYRAIPGGPFAPPGDGFICSAEDLVLGLTAEQDERSVTLSIHFERYAYESMKLRVPVEKLFAADIWPGEVCIFFRGDKQNPVLWGELGGHCVPGKTTWRLGSSEDMRRRQSEPSNYSPSLTVVLEKAPHSSGKWDLVLRSGVQAKLMVKSWENSAERFEGLSGARTAKRAGYDLDSPDFWGYVDDYVNETMKRTGHSSAPKKMSPVGSE